MSRLSPEREEQREQLFRKLARTRRGWSVREYDLTYWQMLSALGFSIPSRIEARWPNEMNGGNPYKCGMCEARHLYPELHGTQAS